jgi:hypothetical protein
MRNLRTPVLVVLMVPACSGDEDLPTQEGPPEAGSGSIRCSYFYRESYEVMEGQSEDDPIFQHEERSLEVGPNETANEAMGQLELRVGYNASENEGSSFSLAVATTDGAALFSTLYQFAPFPKNQFIGGHGFTGLLYFRHPTAGGDYQAFCESVSS